MLVLSILRVSILKRGEDKDSMQMKWRKKKWSRRIKTKIYNTRDSLVVSDRTASLALAGLSMGERTGSRAFLWVVVVGAKDAEFGSPGV